jgi:hypothetical protein
MSYSPNGWDTLICWKCHNCGFAVAGLVKSPQEKNALWNDTQATRQTPVQQAASPVSTGADAKPTLEHRVGQVALRKLELSPEAAYAWVYRSDVDFLRSAMSDEAGKV